jgi:hypothetical protein
MATFPLIAERDTPVTKAIVLGIRLSEDDHAALARAAAADQRSMSALAGKVLTEWLRANGYPPRPAKGATPKRAVRRPA